ncbi:MAG: hypothetical protein K2O00_00895 [Muribaculaceae bacterium]|nr:hypothetical protein [Muribaculaceae bacterium]
MKHTIIALLLLLTSCATSRKQESFGAYQTASDSVTAVHVEAIRHTTDSTRLLTLVTIDSLNIAGDTAKQLRVYGVRIRHSGKRTSATVEALTADSVSQAVATAAAHFQQHESSPVTTPPRIHGILLVAVGLLALLSFLRLSHNGNN